MNSRIEYDETILTLARFSFLTPPTCSSHKGSDQGNYQVPFDLTDKLAYVDTFDLTDKLPNVVPVGANGVV